MGGRKERAQKSDTRGVISSAVHNCHPGQIPYIFCLSSLKALEIPTLVSFRLKNKVKSVSNSLFSLHTQSYKKVGSFIVSTITVVRRFKHLSVL